MPCNCRVVGHLIRIGQRGEVYMFLRWEEHEHDLGLLDFTPNYTSWRAWHLSPTKGNPEVNAAAPDWLSILKHFWSSTLISFEIPVIQNSFHFFKRKRLSLESTSGVTHLWSQPIMTPWVSSQTESTSNALQKINVGGTYSNYFFMLWKDKVTDIPKQEQRAEGAKKVQ